MEEVNGSDPVGEKPQKVRDPVTGHLVFDSPVHQRAREYYWQHKGKERENFDHLYGEYPTVGKQGADVEMQEWTTGQVAEYYHVVPGTVLNWIRDGVFMQDEVDARMSLVPGSTRVSRYIIYNKALIRIGEQVKQFDTEIRGIYPRAVAKVLKRQKEGS